MVEPHFLPPDAAYWLVDGIPAGLNGGQPRPQPGAESTYELVLRPDTMGELDGTGMSDHVDRYRDLRDRARHANTIAMDVRMDDKVIYAVGRADFDPLVSVRPGRYDETGIGIWGLITAIEGAPSLPQAVAQLSVDVAFIAEYSRYADKAAVRDAHERSGFH